MVSRHVTLGQQREERVRPPSRQRRKVITRGGVVLVHEAHEGARVETIAGDQQYMAGITSLHSPAGMLQHLDCRSTPVGRVHQPAHPEPKADGQVDGVIRRQRERRHPESVDIVGRKACVSQRPLGSIDEHRRGRHLRRRMTSIGRLGGSRDQCLHCVILVAGSD